MENEKILQLRMTAWKNSEHYEWVTQMLKEEVEANYVKDLITVKAQQGEPMSSEEIGDLLKIEVQTSLRIQAVLDRLT